MADDYQRANVRRHPGRFRRQAGHRGRGLHGGLHRPEVSARRRAAGTARIREHAQDARRRAPLQRADASCNTAYMNEREMPYWKISAVRDTFLHDHPSAPIDPRVHDPSYDLPSARRGRRSFSTRALPNISTKSASTPSSSPAATPRAASAPPPSTASAIATGRSFRKTASAISRNSRTTTTCATSAAATSISATSPACSPTSRSGESRTRDGRHDLDGPQAKRPPLSPSPLRP